MCRFRFENLEKQERFHKQKWYCKIMSMNDERPPFKLLTNEWDKEMCKGYP